MVRTISRTVNFSVDRWWNVYSEPKLYAVVPKKDINYLVDITNMFGNSYTIMYLKNVKKYIIYCEKELMWTDNTFSRKEMHTQFQTDSDLNLITYWCSVQSLNLLAEDLNIWNIKEQVLFIVNFFRNNHFANAKYREARRNE